MLHVHRSVSIRNHTCFVNLSQLLELYLLLDLAFSALLGTFLTHVLQEGLVVHDVETSCGRMGSFLVITTQASIFWILAK